ncbi:hypothetical protein AB1484_19680 [Parafrankia sp. FMc6]|uniref:hypothetical protein n=1 Tax=Parafrankia soli TaxID=2599596 RepID=UPI0034D56E76
MVGCLSADHGRAQANRLRHPEPVYVQSGSHAEKTAERNPAEQVRYLGFKPDVSTVTNFALGLRHMFTSAGPRAGGFGSRSVSTTAFCSPPSRTDGSRRDQSTATCPHSRACWPA